MLEVSPQERPAVARQKDARKSRITNGSALLPGVDGRSPWVRRCKDVIAAHLSDMGGEGNTSAAERSLIRRAAVLTTELERLEARFALAGEASPDDLHLYQRMTNTLRRCFETIGIERRPRNVTPTLSELLAHDPPMRFPDPAATPGAPDAQNAPAVALRPLRGIPGGEG
jgi:hypothetical protein